MECLRLIYPYPYPYSVHSTVPCLKRLNIEILNREVTPNGRAVRIAPLFCTGMIEATISQQHIYIIIVLVELQHQTSNILLRVYMMVPVRYHVHLVVNFNTCFTMA